MFSAHSDTGDDLVLMSSQCDVHSVEEGGQCKHLVAKVKHILIE